MQRSILSELNYSNNSLAFVTYTVGSDVQFAPIYLLDHDDYFVFNFHKDSVHFDAVTGDKEATIVVGNVYANKIAKFTYSLEVFEVLNDEELADYAWREEVEYMFKGDERSSKRVVCKVWPRRCFLFNEKGKLAEEIDLTGK